MENSKGLKLKKKKIERWIPYFLKFGYLSSKVIKDKRL
jgi:hypothetical protein